MKSTVIIPQDKKHKHLITLPVEIWKGLGLIEGDIIEIDVKTVIKPQKEEKNEEYKL